MAAYGDLLRLNGGFGEKSRRAGHGREREYEAVPRSWHSIRAPSRPRSAVSEVRQLTLPARTCHWNGAPV